MTVSNVSYATALVGSAAPLTLRMTVAVSLMLQLSTLQRRP